MERDTELFDILNLSFGKELRNILIMPVAPHLSVDRAIVLSEGSVVSVEVRTGHEAVLSIDGRQQVLPEDVQALFEGLAPGTAAAALAIEHRWAIGLAEAIENVGGEVALFTHLAVPTMTRRKALPIAASCAAASTSTLWPLADVSRPTESRVNGRSSAPRATGA